jgi:hypothetical protein
VRLVELALQGGQRPSFGIGQRRGRLAARGVVTLVQAARGYSGKSSNRTPQAQTRPASRARTDWYPS